MLQVWSNSFHFQSGGFEGNEKTSDVRFSVYMSYTSNNCYVVEFLYFCFDKSTFSFLDSW